MIFTYILLEKYAKIKSDIYLNILALIHNENMKLMQLHLMFLKQVHSVQHICTPFQSKLTNSSFINMKSLLALH